jgi:hypothetical protein
MGKQKIFDIMPDNFCMMEIHYICKIYAQTCHQVVEPFLFYISLYKWK